VLGVRCRICVNTLFWHAQWDKQPKIKMPDISDILDVAIEDLSLEQLQQLKDATD
jgi:hypothetical protein